MSYFELPDRTIIDRTVVALKERHFEPLVVKTSAEALAKIKELIPAGASVMNGASRTLEEIGFVEYLKSGKHGWNNLHTIILAKTDKTKQALLRKQSVLSDYYLGSVHALAETGELVIASNSGSQLPHLVFTSPNIILVAGAQKIVPTLTAAFKRLEDYVVPLEDERLREQSGIGTMLCKVLTFHRENPKSGRRVRIIIVQEKLGF